MKIVIGYPPIETKKGSPQLSQNRQFQWTRPGLTAYAIYPVVLASAATMLQAKGHQVLWADGIAEKISFGAWLEQVSAYKPDLVVLETKTPVVKKHWQICKIVKHKSPGVQVVMVGDHVTALPQETLKNSPTDWIATGGDYDFMLANLAEHLQKAKKLEPGFWYRDGKKLKTTGDFQLNHNLTGLPIIDRQLTRWELYAYKNSNFFNTPGAYTMFGRDCWWGRCKFCSWTTLFPGKDHRVVSVKQALVEVKMLVTKFGVKEIMDDSGTFMVGPWLKEFCQGLISQGLNTKVKIDCNMRFMAGLTQPDYDLMAKAGFRFILYGLESGWQQTLTKLNKNIDLNQVEPNLTMAKQAGLNPHITVMVGYPWETKQELDQTVELVKRLARKGLIDSVQGTIVIPYPGTALFAECKKKKLLKTLDWARYDMTGAVMKTKLTEQDLKETIRTLFNLTVWNISFVKKTIRQLMSWSGIKYVSFQAVKYLGKLGQFN